MEVRHQEVIQKNFVELIDRANTTSLLQNLSTKKVFSDGTFEALQNLRGKNQTRQFFLDVQKRGPDAFKNLIKALIETRQRSLAELLDPRKEFFEDEIRGNRKSLRVFVRSEELKFCDIAVIVIMSHGGKNSANKEYFLDVNGNAILTSEVENLFSNRNCPYMQKKPKIIAYQLCRGRINDKGITPGADDIVFNNFSHEVPISKVESDGAPEKICESSDLLIIHSTIPEYTANRDIYTGSWFIQLLCKVFMKYACNMDVENMLKLIKEELQRLRSAQGVMQTMEYTNRSFNLCFLNPGIFIEDGAIHFYK